MFFVCGSDAKEKLIDDYFGTEWVPSHQSEVFQTSESWNTVGIPTVENTKPLKHQDGNRIVRKAVRDIESGLYNKDYQDRRKDVIEEKIDITQAKLYWQEREKSLSDQAIKVPVAADYYTDYPAEGERDENVIVLKLDQSDGVILRPDASILLTPIVPKKKAKPKEGMKSTRKPLLEIEKENLPNYERNWNQRRKDLWDSDTTDSPTRHFAKDYSEAEDRARKVLKFQTSYPNDTGMSQIPRVRTGRICKACNKTIQRDHCPNCTEFIRSSVRERNLLKQDSSWMSLDSQRSRKNFFGNSGSYTLRCNLNPISRSTSRKKKFYLTPETLQLDYLKKFNEPKITYENFTAKKREFRKHRTDFFSQFEGLKKNSDTVLW